MNRRTFIKGLLGGLVAAVAVPLGLGGTRTEASAVTVSQGHWKGFPMSGRYDPPTDTVTLELEASHIFKVVEPIDMRRYSMMKDFEAGRGLGK